MCPHPRNTPPHIARCPHSQWMGISNGGAVSGEAEEESLLWVGSSCKGWLALFLYLINSPCKVTLKDRAGNPHSCEKDLFRGGVRSPPLLKMYRTTIRFRGGHTQKSLQLNKAGRVANFSNGPCSYVLSSHCSRQWPFSKASPPPLLLFSLSRVSRNTSLKQPRQAQAGSGLQSTYRWRQRCPGTICVCKGCALTSTLSGEGWQCLLSCHGLAALVCKGGPRCCI